MGHKNNKRIAQEKDYPFKAEKGDCKQIGLVKLLLYNLLLYLLSKFINNSILFLITCLIYLFAAIDKYSLWWENKYW